MKNPLKYLKHIVKDPVNNIAEADARKKEIMLVLYISLGLFALGLILQLAAGLNFMGVLTFIGVAGMIFAGFLIWVIGKTKERFNGLTCDKCNTLAEIKTPEDFAKYISFVVEKDEAIYKGYKGSREPTNGVYSLVKVEASSSAVLSVQLTCPHCGEVKHLKYTAEPFKCHMEKEKVGAPHIAAIKTSMENAVRTVVNEYNNPDKKTSIPYSIHSSKNPNFAERTTFKGANASDAHPNYMGVKIDKHQDVEETLEHYFVLNQINGTLTNPSKSKKK